jgi:predicted lipoprotein with Yx(FWY)xxD motif
MTVPTWFDGTYSADLNHGGRYHRILGITVKNFTDQLTFVGGMTMSQTSWKVMALMMCAFVVLATAFAERVQAAAEDQSPSVKIAEAEGLGRYLTDSAGMTLYYFTLDSTNKSTCMGPCLERWPIFYSEITMVPAGCDKSDFSVITREDGKKQTTYKGKPLYYYFRDSKPGDIKGQGMGGVWYIVEP